MKITTIRRNIPKAHTTDKPRSIASWCIVGHAAGFATPRDARFVIKHRRTPQE